MPTVLIPALMQRLTDGVDKVAVEGTTLREVLDNLEHAYPGIKSRLCDKDRIRPNIAVYIDGIVSREGLRQSVSEETEIHFLPSISGGCNRHAVVHSPVLVAPVPDPVDAE